jgi:hypothetical protein
MLQPYRRNSKGGYQCASRSKIADCRMGHSHLGYFVIDIPLCSRQTLAILPRGLPTKFNRTNTWKRNEIVQ